MGAWEVAIVDERGARQGEYRSYRRDGTLLRTCRYQNGVEDGRFSVYHPNGQLARAGDCIAGEIEGLMTSYASDAPTSESLRPCCVPTGAHELRASYVRGNLTREQFFDREGFLLLHDGSRVPEPPNGLPEQTSPANGNFVTHYAKESSKHIVAGVVTLSDMGYKTLSKYYSELMPDGANASAGVGSPNGVRNAHSPWQGSPPLEPEFAGTVSSSPSLTLVRGFHRCALFVFFVWV